MQNLINKLINKRDLTQDEAFKVALEILSGSLAEAEIAKILTSLHEKVESVPEIVGFIRAIRKKMTAIAAPRGAIDVCGTGGDGSGTFNISTVVAFVVAGTGVSVVKHGNRAATSKCGSADVIEALRITINLKPEQAEKVLKNAGMVFLYAPLFHPAFKQVAGIRKKLGFRTIFNFIGPFANPARVMRQLIGVPTVAIAEKLADVGRELGYEHLLIVSSDDGLDEISIFANTAGFEIKREKIRKMIIEPQEKVKNSRPKLFLTGEGILGGTVEENAEIIRNILSGKKGQHRDIVVLNSAFALYIAGKVKTPEEGIKLAQESIDSGEAFDVLQSLIMETRKYE